MNIIEISNLSKYFGKTKALDGFYLSVEQGEVMGFVGPNGAGKSTTIRILLGLLKKTSGDVQLFGKNPWIDVKRLHKNLVYVPGEVYLWPNLTGGETIDFLARLHGEDTSNSKYKELKSSYSKRFDLDLSKKNKTYSKGNRQKVALVSAFINESKLLLLDEPTSGLDPLIEEVFSKCITELKERNKTVLLSSHIMEEVENLADKITIIKDGKNIITGTSEDIRKKTMSDISDGNADNISLQDAVVDLYNKK
jgi:ABC-2 type transport system ATP-binding protein